MLEKLLKVDSMVYVDVNKHGRFLIRKLRDGVVCGGAGDSNRESSANGGKWLAKYCDTKLRASWTATGTAACGWIQCKVRRTRQIAVIEHHDVQLTPVGQGED